MATWQIAYLLIVLAAWTVGGCWLYAFKHQEEES